MADQGGSDFGGPTGAGIGPGETSSSGSTSDSSSGYGFGMHDDQLGQQEHGKGYNIGNADNAQATFNAINGITTDNPYGKQGFFSRTFGIDPQDISYADQMSFSTRQAIANNQFSKFANPQNIPGQIGYNPAFPTAEKGKLRPGVQKAGFETQYGKVMGQYAEQSTPDMIARGIMGLFGGPVGLAAAQIGTQEYGIPGLPGFESFDPNNPRGPQSIAGKVASALTGGIDPTQAAAKAASAANAISDYFSGKPSAPAQVQSVTQQAPVQGFEDAKSRFSTGVSRPDVNLNVTPSKGLQGFFDNPTPDNPVPGVKVEPLAKGMSRLSFPDGRTTTMNADGTINSFGL